MTEITNEYGTFRAETEQAALKLAHKAKRQALRAEKIRDSRRARAYFNAREAGYGVHERFAQIRAGERALTGWDLWHPGEKFGPVVESHRYADVAEYTTVHGCAKCEHAGYRVVGAVLNVAGFHLATVLRSIDGPVEFHVLAVGVCEGEAAFAVLTGISREDLEKACRNYQR